MSYDSIFSSMALDMIALESAVQLYEVENDIDEGYLNGSVSYDESEANESATESINGDLASDFAFGGDLFKETIAMEAEGSDGSSDSSSDTSSKKKESFGSKLKNGIKSILSAIGKFFATIGSKIREIGSKISAKFKEIAEKSSLKKENKLRDAVIKEAGNVRKAFQQAVNILDNSVKTSATEVNKICIKINEAINKAKGDSGNFDANKDNLASVGKSYGDDAEKDISTMEKHVKNAEDAQSHVSSAIDSVKNAYDNLCVKMTKLKVQNSKNARLTENERASGDQKSYDARANAVRKQNEEARKSFNEEHKNSQITPESRGAAGVGETTDTVGLTREMIRSILIMEEYSQKTNLSKLQSECNAVADTCKTNQDFCSKAAAIADNDIGSDNKDARKAYNLCKLYMRASKVFTMISSHITQLSTGNVFGSGSDGIKGDRKFAKADD